MADVAALSLRCPKCGNVLQVERLVVEDEGGHDEVLCIDCPTTDFRRAVSAKQIAEVTTQLLVARLKQELYYRL